MPSLRGPDLVVVDGLDGWFEPLARSHALVRSELIAITRPAILKSVDFSSRAKIGVHVRLGDFATSYKSDRPAQYFNTRIDLAWYADVVVQIRKAVGPLPLEIYSDGQDDELKPLLQLPSASRVNTGTSLGDMLSLSSAGVIIGSRSSFSMWAAFLANGISFWYPGKETQIFASGSQEFVVERPETYDMPAQRIVDSIAAHGS
jgi:hypothetical protein